MNDLFHCVLLLEYCTRCKVIVQTIPNKGVVAVRFVTTARFVTKVQNFQQRCLHVLSLTRYI